MLFNRITNLSIAITVTTVLMSCSGNKPEAETINETTITVETVLPNGGSITGMIEASGQVEAAHSVNISTRVMGYITKMQVKIGDHVSSGQLLFTVSSNDISAKRSQTDAMITQAEAALHSAQKDLERFTVLYKQQSASAKELDNVTLQYQSAKANVEAAKQMRNEVSAQLAYTSVTAPFSGTVTQKMADEGSMANPGMPILTIEQAGTLQVSASIPENEIASVKTSDDAVMIIESAGKKINGKVIQINPSSQFTGGQYLVKIGVNEADSKQLYTGMYVHIQIPSKEKTIVASKNNMAVMIPVKAIINRDQLTGVYTIGSQNTALLRWVRLGNTIGNNVEVLSGLANNEPIILSSEGNLYNGAPVKIKK